MKKIICLVGLIFSLYKPAIAQIQGIDIHDNGIYSWPSIPADTKMPRFCYVKATESIYTVYPNFAIRTDSVVIDKMTVGAYHFGTPLFSSAFYQPGYDHTDEVGAEVTNFVTAAKGRYGNGYLPPVLDIEAQPVSFNPDKTPKLLVDPLSGVVTLPNGTPTGQVEPHMTAGQLAQWIGTWVNQVAQKTGVMPLLYCEKSYAEALYPYFTNKTILCNLLIATTSDPMGSPKNTTWSNWPWVFQQYSQTGMVSGIWKNVDLEYFPGTQTDFNNLINQTVNQTPNIDLTVTNATPSVSPATVAAGSSVNVSCAESNGGTSSAGANDVTVWLSADNVLQPSSDINIGKISFSGVAANSETLINSATLTIPAGTPPGSYYLFFWADGGQVVPETNENNNTVSIVIAITAPSQPLPDLLVQNAAVSPTTVAPGALLTASCSNQNQGGSTAGTSVTSLWLSPDQSFVGAPTDIYLGEINIPSLTAGQSSTVLTQQVTLPTGNYSGTWYILFGADGGGAVSESNEANNQLFLPITFGNTTAPAAPVLSLTPQCNGSTTEVVLNWTTTASATTYDVYRNNAVLSQGLTGNQFTNTSVTAGQSYTYYVIAQTPSGTYTSVTQSAAAPDCTTLTPPGAPVLSLAATCSGTTGQVYLSWNSVAGAVAYDIYRNSTYVTTISSGTQYTDANVQSGVSYSYYVRSTNGAGGSNSATQSILATNCNVQLPGAPTLSLRPGCLNGVPQIVLDWTSATGAQAYDIYRNGSYAATVSNNTQYDDVTLTSNATYTYTVQATNGAGGTSSNSTSAVALDCSAILPGVPLLTVTPECNGIQGSIILNWSVSNAILCKIYRDGVVYPDIYGTTGQFEDDYVTSGTTYTYYIEALNNVGDNYSAQVSATPIDCTTLLPAAPVLTATSTCSGDTATVNLSWTTSATAGSYDIYRNGNLYFANVVVGTQFIDMQVTANSNYTYYVVAKNTNGSAASGTQSVNVVSCLIPPVISSFMPAAGITGTTVTISGAHLENATNVSFGSLPAKSYTVLSSTSISAVVGQGASGNISVTTPGGTIGQAGFTYVFTLPSDNFTVFSVSATCHQVADGEIHIRSAQPENFGVQVTSNNGNSNYTFTDSLVIRNLLYGTYHVCITVNNQPEYQQCFDLVISQPPALDVVPSVNTADHNVKLQLTWGDIYLIALNGQTYSTRDSSVILPLIPGDNTLSVTTDKLCQGTFAQHIVLNTQLEPYPDPFTNTLKLNLNGRQVTLMQVIILEVGTNKVMYNKQINNPNGVVELDVPDLRSGPYVMVLQLDQVKTTFKIVRQ